MIPTSNFQFLSALISKAVVETQKLLIKPFPNSNLMMPIKNSYNNILKTKFVL